MRYIILFYISLMFIGCIEVQSKDNGSYYCSGCQTQRHEGCEYVIFGGYANAHSGVSITHKGNCDNPIHK